MTGVLPKCIWDFLRQIIPVPAAETDYNFPRAFRPYDEAVGRLCERSGDERDSTLVELSRSLFDDEEQRRASIEARAGTVLAASGIIAPIVLAIPTWHLGKHDPPLECWSHTLLLVGVVLCLLYLAGAAILAIRLQRGSLRETLGPDELVNAHGTSEGFRREIAALLLRHTISNYRVDNSAIEELGNAQLCLRNAVVVLVITGIAVVVSG